MFLGAWQESSGIMQNQLAGLSWQGTHTSTPHVLHRLPSDKKITAFLKSTHNNPSRSCYHCVKRGAIPSGAQPFSPTPIICFLSPCVQITYTFSLSCTRPNSHYVVSLSFITCLPSGAIHITLFDLLHRPVHVFSHFQSSFFSVFHHLYTHSVLLLYS